MNTSTLQPLPNIAEAPVSWGDHGTPADGFKALVIPNTGQVLPIVPKCYRFIRHEEAVFRLEDIIQKSPGLGQFEVKQNLNNEGARIRQT